MFLAFNQLFSPGNFIYIYGRKFFRQVYPVIRSVGHKIIKINIMQLSE